jgi:hypothetical protein
MARNFNIARFKLGKVGQEKGSVGTFVLCNYNRLGTAEEALNNETNKILYIP